MSESPISASSFAGDVIRKLPDVESRPLEGNRIELLVPADKIREVVSMVSDAIEDAFPESVFGVDLENDKYELIYIFWSQRNRMLIQIRVSLEGANPSVDSVSEIFSGFEWHERETHEMFGIGFNGHPDLRLLLLPDELKGKYPLRKRFETDRSRLAESGLPQTKARPGAGGEE